jgi:hypothetical protein
VFYERAGCLNAICRPNVGVSSDGVQEAYERGHAGVDSEVTDYFLEEIRERKKNALVAAIFFAKCKLGWQESRPPVDTIQAAVIVLPAGYSPEAFLAKKQAREIEGTEVGLPGPPPVATSQQ